MKPIFSLLLLCIVSVAFSQDKTVNKSFASVKSIRITVASGDITIRKSTSTDVKVSLKYSYDDDDYTPRLEQNGDRLTLKEEFSHGSHSGSSSWNLEIPDNLSVNISTGSGDVIVADVKTDLKSNAGSGDVEISRVSGTLDFNSGSGSVDVSELSGDIRVNCGSGDIKISKSQAEVSVNAGSGNISLTDLKGKIKANVGSGDIRSKQIVLTGAGSFNSGSGDVTVSLGAALNNNISVNSGSGNATLDFNGNEISGVITMTANKRNGNIVAPFKFDTEETISEGNRSDERIEKTVKLGNKDIQIKVGTGSGTAEITK